MERTRYRELRARLKSEIEAQHRLLGYVSLSPTFMASICGLRSQDVEAVWQTLVKEFNLELDGAGYNSWAPAGQQVSKEHVDLIKTKIDALKKKVSSSP